MQTVFLGKSNQGFLATSDNENIGLSGSAALSIGILHVHDVVASQMFFNVDDLTDSADVVSAGDVASIADFILDPLQDLSGTDFVLDGISGFDFGVGEPDGSGIMGDDV